MHGDRAVARSRAQRRQLAADDDAPVAGVDVERAADVARANAAVAGVQLKAPLDPLDVDRSVSALRRDVGRRRQGDDEPSRAAAEVEPARARLAHRHLDAVAALLRVHVDLRDVVFAAAALLDDDLHLGPVPRTNLDGSVEGRQHHVRLARHLEALLLALDVAADVGADDVDAARSRDERGEQNGTGDGPGMRRAERGAAGRRVHTDLRSS